MDVPEPTRAAAAALTERLAALRASEPKLRIRDAAQRLGVSEMELVALNLGKGATRLCGPWADIVRALPGLGQVMALTRNEHAVHEKTGIYENVEVGGPHGLVLGTDIDLRLFLAQWKHGFAVREATGDLVRHSLQFFDRHGGAVHKVYMNANSDMDRYGALVAEFRHAEQAVPAVEPTAAAAAPLADAAIDVSAYLAAWDALKDTHEFFPMLRKHKLARTQALRLAGPDRARPVANASLRATLEAAAARDLPIMVFVGNAGCIQIHTGPVTALRATGPWFNVLDPGFNLHLRETAIASSWVVTKPTSDGPVTSLELFDAAGENIALLFGKRKPGQPEDAAWRALAHGLCGDGRSASSA
ncbi:MAG: hemin-degrading factor [Alphaproteobacteria bacterium]|nr:hemin-degrading factor [Alphaproteobacteria bacterium]